MVTIIRASKFAFMEGVGMLRNLVVLGLFGYIALITVGAGMVAQNNIEKCWKKHGITLACKGDGRYDPRLLNRPDYR
ncbi:hypothetical protein D3C80_1911970 [compost metagenome]